MSTTRSTCPFEPGELDDLDARQQDVLRWRYGIATKPKTLQAIGDLLGVSKERVRQIESRALADLHRRRGETWDGLPWRERTGRASG
jgi:hypothetical protein